MHKKFTFICESKVEWMDIVINPYDMMDMLMTNLFVQLYRPEYKLGSGQYTPRYVYKYVCPLQSVVCVGGGPKTSTAPVVTGAYAGFWKGGGGLHAKGRAQIWFQC